MAREKDENKRQIILQTAKMLFSRKGFFNTSVSDIKQETGLPVGSIYTYFSSKEEIVRVIVEEGWTDLHARLADTLKGCRTPEDKLEVLVQQFLPELFNDIELINILLSEAIDYTKIEEKIEALTNLISEVLLPLWDGQGVFKDFSRKTMQTALIVYFLGVMNAVKLSKISSIGITITDILDFLRLTIENSLDMEIS